MSDILSCLKDGRINSLCSNCSVMPVTYQSAIESADNSCCGYRAPEIKASDCETNENKIVNEMEVSHV